MKKFLTSLKRQDGFTLVELMVVVAIIGLLSAVAIPNFKKYQAKSKTSEAKLQLSALYTAEQAFCSDYNMYAMCLRYMGFDPFVEQANRYYAVGFGDNAAAAISGPAYTSAQNSGLNITACPNDVDADLAAAANADATFFVAGKGVGGTIINSAALMTGTTGASLLGDQASAANMTFTAQAVGYISQDVTAANASTFTINEQKVLSNVVNGY